jgi:membrane associated rhomboid family serine protease
MNKIRLGAFAGIFAVLAIIFFFMFAGQMTQNEAWTSMPALAFSIISAAATVLMLIGYVLFGRSQANSY